MATQLHPTAALLVTEGVKLGADGELLQRYTDTLTGTHLDAVAQAIEDAKGITLIAAFLNVPTTENDDCIPSAMALLLADLGPESFVSHLPRLAPLLRAVTDTLITHRAFHYKENPIAVAGLLTDVLASEHLQEVIEGVSTEKLKALVTVIIAQESEYGGLDSDDKAARQNMIEQIAPHLTITDDPATLPSSDLTLGFAFRKQYVNAVFPHTTFGKDVRFYYPDRIIDRMAALQANGAAHSEDNIAVDFNVFLIDEPTPAEIEEAFSYLHLFRGLTGRNWKCAFAALRHMKRVPYADDYSALTGHEKAQCEAIITVLAEVFKKETTAIPGMENLLDGDDESVLRRNVVWRLSDQRLIDFLLEHPERANEVAAVARDRNTLDWGMLTVTLGKPPALSSGAL